MFVLSNREKAMAKKKGKKVGRPRTELNERQIMTAAALGSTYEEIAALLGICAKTLANGKTSEGRPWKDVIEQGRLNGNVSLRRRMWAMAMSESKGAATMLIWLSKNRLGMTDKVEVDNSKLPPPPNIQVVFVTKEEERRRISTPPPPAIEMVPAESGKEA